MKSKGWSQVILIDSRCRLVPAISGSAACDFAAEFLVQITTNGQILLSGQI
jgi:hypothetical protein